MSTDIYYFTGTGNSLAVARDLAGGLEGKLIPIRSLMTQTIVRADADVIGLVFPVYYATFGQSGLPRIVERFIGKLDGIDSRYLFAVCTHSGMSGSTIENADQMIRSRGGRLAGGFAVKMSNPYSTPEKLRYVLLHQALETDARADCQIRKRLYDGWKTKLETIHAYVRARQTGRRETRGAIGKRLLTPFLALQNQAAMSRYRGLSHTADLPWAEVIPLADRSFQFDERCNGCGLCVKLCPVQNIELADGRPVWKHSCETCFACFQWCPKKAIHGDIVEYEKRYHHPDVKVSDMLLR